MLFAAPAPTIGAFLAAPPAPLTLQHGDARDEGLAPVQAKTEAAYPGYGYLHFLEIGLPAEWERQATRTGAK